jgi:hypothetical protein
MGLPGAGKTTIAHARNRIEQNSPPGMDVRPHGQGGATAIADFVCPTQATRAAFGDASTIWVDCISAGLDTEGTPQILRRTRACAAAAELDPQKPTALFVGRGHYILIDGAHTALDPAGG